MSSDNLAKLILKTPDGYSAEIHLHGAHVTRWIDPSNNDILFLSKHAIFKEGIAIRGGIPICFPQFANLGPFPKQHGFTRNSLFQLASVTDTTARFRLHHSAQDHPDEYPYDFDLLVTISIYDDGLLKQSLTVQNPSTTTSLEFTAALHTYFKLYHSIENASVVGLQGLHYLDSLQNRQKCIENDEIVIFPGEVDRIYLNTIAQPYLTVRDGINREVTVEQSGFQDAVVWNPAADKARSMADFGDDEWKDMVCVEVAQAGSGAITLDPGQEWTGTQILNAKTLNATI